MLRAAGREAAVGAGFLVVFVALFSPVLFGHRFLTTGGDGISIGLPAYLRAPALWEPNVMLGYPWSANLNGFWDPVAAALRAIPHTFNLYMLVAYVVAAFGTYLLVVASTGSRVAGVISGLAYSMGGFMISHLGHYDVVHPAAWAPWVLWAFTTLRARIEPQRIAAGALAIALTAASGQPQVLAYTLLLSLAFVVVASMRVEHCSRYLLACALTFVTGIGLAAIALLPGIELARASVRAKLTLDTFLTFSNPPHEIPIRMLFPYFLGLTLSPVYPFSAVDFQTWTELSNYAGLTTLVLAAVAAIARFRDPMVRFWIVVASVALALSAGESDGFRLAEFTYRLPVLGLFRAQGRHAFEFTLATAVLAGYGAAAIRRRVATRTVVAIAVALVGGAIAATLAAIAVLDQAFAADVVARTGWSHFPLDPLQNPALGIPLLVFGAGASAVFAWATRPASTLLGALAIAVVGADMASFAWFGAWHDASITRADLTAPPYAAAMRASLDRSHERAMVFPPGGIAAGIDPDLNLSDRNVLWGLPLTGGRVQLEIARTAALLHMDLDGLPAPETFENARDPALDLASVRYVILPPGSRGMRAAAAPWDEADMNVRIGAPAWTATSWVPRGEYRTTFGSPLPVSRVALVSSLSDAPWIKQNAQVATVVLTTAGGARIAIPVLAGRDTAEHGYDRPNVRAIVQHARAHVFETQGIDRDYVATFALARRERVASVAIVWTSPNPDHGYLNIDKVSLVDDAAGAAYPLGPMTVLETAHDHWRSVPGLGPPVVLENRRRLGRAWLVHDVATGSDRDALTVIRSGNFDPRTTALVEDAPALRTVPGAGESLTIASATATQMKLAVRCASPCFAVTSDAYDPGWHAVIDGAPVTVYHADYALRGVFVPAGTHDLTFTYRPRNLIVAGAISIASALALGGLALPPVKRRLFAPRARGPRRAYAEGRG